MASNPPPPSPQLLRHDMQAMLSYIQGARIVSIARETAISRLKGWLVGRLWMGVTTALFALFIVYLCGFWSWTRDLDGPLVSGLILIVLASRAGAIISISRRINDDDLGSVGGGDSIFTLASLGSGRNGLALALLSSNVFGLVLFALFASGIPGALGLTGGIAPKFRETATEARAKAQAADAVVADRQKDVNNQCSAAALAPRPATGAASPAPAPSTSPTSAPTAVSAPALATPRAAGGKSTVPSGAPSPAATATPDGGSAADECTGARYAFKKAQQTATELAETASATTNARLPVDGWFDQLAMALGLFAPSDLFKMLIWAFIAGFFEQFVPDMLDTIAARTKQSQQQAAVAGAK
ncbi:hypothetical protein U1839_01905 [Sphingomonas sp. RT2P30]|uniref:hypothetical protein n=1 Tax=Parasphingomonas halimpatiens TaxID=3096162 RepID=UPI002FC8DCB5